MKSLRKKREFPLRAALATLLCLLCATGILFFFLSPFATGDERLDALWNAALPRFFTSIFLLVLAAEIFPDLLSFKKISLKRLLWCLLPLLVAVVNFPFSALIGGRAHVVRTELLWLFSIKCLLIGVSEEVLFRGIVFQALLDCFDKKKRNCFFPVLLSSVIFALFHFINLFDGAGILSVLQQAGYSFLIGAMLAVVLLQTKNLWLCVFLHTLFDFGGLMVFDLGIGDPQDLVFWILTIVVGALCAAQIVLTLVKITFNVRRQSRS